MIMIDWSYDNLANMFILSFLVMMNRYTQLVQQLLFGFNRNMEPIWTPCWTSFGYNRTVLYGLDTGLLLLRCEHLQHNIVHVHICYTSASGVWHRFVKYPCKPCLTISSFSFIYVNFSSSIIIACELLGGGGSPNDHSLMWHYCSPGNFLKRVTSSKAKYSIVNCAFLQMETCMRQRCFQPREVSVLVCEFPL